VVKNTLARRAVKDTEFECMTEGLTGPLVLAFSQEDPGAAARVIKDFAKQNDQLNVKLVAIGGQILAPSELETLAKLPTYDQALSMLMSVMQAPIQKLAQTMNEVPGKLVRTIAAIRDAKEAA
jgi:large subunit ribosomal protein L10